MDALKIFFSEKWNAFRSLFKHIHSFNTYTTPRVQNLCLSIAISSRWRIASFTSCPFDECWTWPYNLYLGPINHCWTPDQNWHGSLVQVTSRGITNQLFPYHKCLPRMNSNKNFMIMAFMEIKLCSRERSYRF